MTDARLQRTRLADVLVAIAVLGSLWGLAEVVLGGAIRAAGLPYRAAILTGIGLGMMGIAVGIVTRCCRKAALIALERCSIPYDVLIAAEDAPRVKPSPEHVLEALRRLGDVEKCVFVGDSLFDRVAAEGAGCAFLPTGRPDWLLKQIMRILFNSVSTNPP